MNLKGFKSKALEEDNLIILLDKDETNTYFLTVREKNYTEEEEIVDTENVLIITKSKVSNFMADLILKSLVTVENVEDELKKFELFELLKTLQCQKKILNDTSSETVK